MKSSTKMLSLVICVCASSLFAQDSSKPVGMMKDKAMAAKKMMMEADIMKAAKSEMMGEKSMMPDMVAKEMAMMDVMHDKMVMKAAEGRMMADDADKKMMMNDEQMSMAADKMMADSKFIQKLFQELVARHLAAKMMGMKKSDAGMMMAGAKEMSKMMTDKDAMMMAKKEMAKKPDNGTMMAREQLIKSLMQDKEVMALVEKAAMMSEDPKMAPMMTMEKMSKSGDSMLQDKAKMNGMMQEMMTRQMVDGQHKMMTK